MAEGTTIEWADHTFNPWEGCARVSPGCQNCYAEKRAHRFGHDVWGKGAPRMVRSDAYWREPLRWEREAAAAGRPALVFCASLADVFEDHDSPMVDPQGRPDTTGASVAGERARLFKLIDETPHLIWLLLTKRPENVLRFVPSRWLTGEDDTAGPVHLWVASGRPAGHWPGNVWIGTTVEDQQRAEERVPALLDVPAPVRFLSCEPLVGPVQLKAHWLKPTFPGPAIGWVITGGETQSGARPSHPDWFRSLRDECARWDVPFLLKQWGDWSPGGPGGEARDVPAHLDGLHPIVTMHRVGKKRAGRHLDGRTHDGFPTEARR